jgi:AAA15 family ATPase/GTPase|eukprot:COSAG01_NODE_981_length_12355_cov_768.539246_6_plen_109_part_00
MFLEEVVLDGFKSYAVRTTVSGFDPEFNAITGLNGSGKSNILDSICFVLGISNLTQVCRRCACHHRHQVTSSECTVLRRLGPGQQPARAGLQAGPGRRAEGDGDASVQ